MDFAVGSETWGSKLELQFVRYVDDKIVCRCGIWTRKRWMRTAMRLLDPPTLRNAPKALVNASCMSPGVVPASSDASCATFRVPRVFHEPSQGRTRAGKMILFY